jgi:hypothetical protein
MAQRHPSSLLRQLPYCEGSSLEDIDRFTPDLALTVVDLSKIKHLPLHHLTASDSAVFDQIPIAVLLAILLSRRAAQKHDGMPFFTEILF